MMMDYDISEPISQGSDEAQEAENRRIAEIAGELSRLCRVYEAQFGVGECNVTPIVTNNEWRNSWRNPKAFGYQ
jgi:hypothetical protein